MLEEFYDEGFSLPCMVTYHVENFVGDISLTVSNEAGEKTVVILDEYDAPIMRLLYEKEQLEAMRTMRAYRGIRQGLEQARTLAHYPRK